MASSGAFTVSDDALNARAILFVPVPGNGAVPPEQLSLKAEIQRVLVDLDRIYPSDNPEFQQAFLRFREQLKVIAEKGLSGPAARPDIAADMLQQLRQRTVLGPFNVEEQDREIVFRTNSGIKPSEEQLMLKSQIEQASAQLGRIYPEGDEENEACYRQYHQALLGLARVGLTGAQAQPNVAVRALQNWKDDILLREGPKVKNNYMKSLGRAALGGALFASVVWTLASLLTIEEQTKNTPFTSTDAKVWAQFALLWIGCMAGVWLSFGARKTEFRFEDLSKLEADLVEPSLRVVFAGLLAMILGAFFYLGVLTVSVGGISTALFASYNPLAALMLGALCGVSESVLASKVMKQAETFLTFKQ